jgi:hypothetical protein
VLDLMGILFSSVMILLVIVRAVQMDRTQPWFQHVRREPDPISVKRRTWHRRN